MKEIDFLRSEEFVEELRKQVEKDTWEKGLPMVYLKDNKIVRHFSDGTIEVIKEVEFQDVKVDNNKFRLKDEEV